MGGSDWRGGRRVCGFEKGARGHVINQNANVSKTQYTNTFYIHYINFE